MLYPLVNESPEQNGLEEGYVPTVLGNHNIGGLVQDCSNSSALAMELLQSCTKP